MAFAVLTAVNYHGRLIDIVYAKGMKRDKSWVEFSKWNAISRVEVDNQGGAKVVVIDADASTYIMGQDPKESWEGSAYQKNLMSAAPSVTNILRPHGDYAIIGPGGGVDVLRAVANGSPSVTGIEINPIIATTIMRDRYKDWSYGLYLRPECPHQRQRWPLMGAQFKTEVRRRPDDPRRHLGFHRRRRLRAQRK